MRKKRAGSRRVNYVIIGAGPAGVVAAETLRRHDPAGAVSLLGD